MMKFLLASTTLFLATLCCSNATNTGKLLGVCGDCKKDIQCESGKCWGYKCVEGSTYTYMRECFKKECAACSSAFDCATGWCNRGKCAFTQNGRMREACHGDRRGAPLCTPCSTSTDCATRKCWGGKCVLLTEYSYLQMLDCGFKKECDSCNANNECATKRCRSGVCTFRWRVNGVQRCADGLL